MYVCMHIYVCMRQLTIAIFNCKALIINYPVNWYTLPRNIANINRYNVTSV